jgi:undecaprenyl-diphosphatase
VQVEADIKMIEIVNTFEKADIELFYLVNGFHSETLDFIMYWISYKWTWVPLYIFLFVFILKSFDLKHGILIIVSIFLLVTLADRISTGVLKPYFKRYRPTHNIELKEPVHTVDNYHGSKYGFVSSHAANTFAVAVFFSLIFRNKNFRWLFLWAALNCYSRIYLGVHYPLDIFFGACLGILLAIGIYWLYKYSRPRLIPLRLDSSRGNAR